MRSRGCPFFSLLCCISKSYNLTWCGISAIKTKGVHEMKWLARHIIAQHVTTLKRCAVCI
jgi:hypothetical protein